MSMFHVERRSRNTLIIIIIIIIIIIVIIITTTRQQHTHRMIYVCTSEHRHNQPRSVKLVGPHPA